MPLLLVGHRGAQGTGCDGDLRVSREPGPRGTGRERNRDAAAGLAYEKREEEQETNLHFKLMNLRRKTRSCPARRCAGPCPHVQQPTLQAERGRGFEFKDVLSRSREVAPSEPRRSEAKARLSSLVSRRGCLQPGLVAGGEQGPHHGTGCKLGTIPYRGGCKPPPGECVLPAKPEDPVRKQPSRAAWDIVTANTKLWGSVKVSKVPIPIALWCYVSLYPRALQGEGLTVPFQQRLQRRHGQILAPRLTHFYRVST